MYIHTDVFAVQSSKKHGQPCGDAHGVLRDSEATTLVLADGLGSGIKANIAASMCVSRLLQLIKMGMTIREAFDAVSATMDLVWGNGSPFAVFTIARILNNGQTTILSYEMPPPLQMNHSYAQVLRDRVYTRQKAIIHESDCQISKGEALVLVSDGISQAGIGLHFPEGWGAEGVRQFLQTHLPIERIDGQFIAKSVHDKGRSYWPENKGDDCSVLVAVNRRGIVVNLLSGPPNRLADDENWVKSFQQSNGIHLICGGSTARITSRILNLHLSVNEPDNTITPPSYSLDGFELVTEGMITLNQAYHLLDEDIELFPDASPATELAEYLKNADRINIWLGLAENLNEAAIEIKQQGLRKRQRIIQKIADRLRNQGKLVIINSL